MPHCFSSGTPPNTARIHFVKEPIALTADERAALNDLLPPERQTGDLHDDLVAAAKEAMRRRERNSTVGGHVLAALHRDVGSWRVVAYATGIPFVTARRWATPPTEADADRAEPAGEETDQ